MGEDSVETGFQKGFTVFTGADDKLRLLLLFFCRAGGREGGGQRNEEAGGGCRSCGRLVGSATRVR